MTTPPPAVATVAELLVDLVAAIGAAVERRGDLGDSARHVVDVLQRDHAAHPPSDTGASAGLLDQLGGVFGLDPLDLRMAVAAVAPELNANFGAAFSLLTGDPREARPTVGLVLELTGVGSMAAAGRRRLAADGSLLRHGLIEVAGDQPFLGRVVRVPDRVTSFLLGDDETIDALVRPVLAAAVALPSDEAAQVARALALGAPLVWIREPPTGSGSSTAAGAFAALDVSYLTITLRHTSATTMRPTLLAAAREAGLRSAGLIVVDADRIAPTDATGFATLRDAAVPAVLVGRSRWDPAWLPELPFTVVAPAMPSDQRAVLWRQRLGPLADTGDPQWADLVALRLTPEQIGQVADAAATTAAAREAPLGLGLVRETARRLSARDGIARRGTGPGLADIALPPDADRALRELIGWFRNRDRVLAQQRGVTGATGSARGITALFAGAPGTGKTLAANVVAAELGLDLLTVDLSSIVDKYIGETEKNLETVFREAESLNVLLFFDEADALFGSRSEVKDARDRYANQEVAYLLQRMETFDGIAVLATNLRGNLDPAFSRRLQFIVHFPDPDRPTRERLWRQHLAELSEQDSVDPIDVPVLAERLEISGGTIRNIVMAAAYSSASTGQPVGHAVLTQAVEREFAKLGRRPPRSV